MNGNELERLRTENDLYRRLLDLSGEHDVDRFLREALLLVLELTGATRGYLELRRETDRPGQPVWWLSQGCESAEVADIRNSLSRGIIAEAIATRRTIATSSALIDPQFSGRASVRSGGIEAVLCAPVGRDPVLGVVYLAGPSRGESWSERERGWAELFARHLGPLADSLLGRQADGQRSGALPPGFLCDEVIGRSEAMVNVLRQAALLAPLEVPVLLTGDSGTGKNLLAEVIHRNSPRRAGPFVDVNCAAVPFDLFESEFFGAREGAHSTARRALKGKVAAAEGGTLFLDEIGEMPSHAQAKLLQLVQSRQYYPLGAAEPVQADIRVIAASNADLTAAMQARTFREDLYHRLCVMPIRMPSLAERPGDVRELARALVGKICQRHHFPRLELSPRAERALEQAEWPGNVRQLAHVLEAGVIRSVYEKALRIDLAHVFPEAPQSQQEDTDSGPLTFQDATRRFQRGLLHETLKRSHWNVSEAARQLDLVRSHVYTLITAFDLRREDDA